MIVKITGRVSKLDEPELNQALDDGDFSAVLELLNAKSVEIEDE